MDPFWGRARPEEASPWGMAYAPPSTSPTAPPTGYSTAFDPTSQSPYEIDATSYNYDDLDTLPDSSDSIAKPISGQGANQHPTPKSLGWTSDTELPKLYKFVVTKGKDPYLELLPSFTATRETPNKVYLDTPRNVQKGIFPCQFPTACLTRKGEKTAFSRPADLERHYRHLHALASAEDTKYPCDYSKCSRAKDPFTRKDHYRDHLRDYHKEDIGSVKLNHLGTGREAERERKRLRETWAKERSVSPQWWRCAKCLTRVSVGVDGYTCRKCGTPCEQERIEIRKRLPPETDRMDWDSEETSAPAEQPLQSYTGLPSTTSTYPALGPTNPAFPAAASTRSAYAGATSTNPSYTGAATTNPSYTGQASTNPSYAGSASTNPPYTGQASTHPSYTGSASTNPSYTGSASTNPSYTGQASTNPSYIGQASTNPSYTGQASTNPSYTGPASTNPSYTGQASTNPSYTAAPSTTPSYPPATSSTPRCSVCNGVEWVDNQRGEWEPCPKCQWSSPRSERTTEWSSHHDYTRDYRSYR